MRQIILVATFWFAMADANAQGCWKAISANPYGYFTLAVANDGSLWSWGYNNYGQLGTGDITNSNKPVRIGSDFNWQSVAAGEDCGFAIKTDGSLWGWGNNSWAQINGSGVGQYDTKKPMRIDLSNNWKSIVAGNDFCLGLKTNGSLWAWGGYNTSGQLGLGSVGTLAFTPTQIGTSYGWKAIAAGSGFSLALKNDGTLWSWGANNFGQLGSGVFPNRASPAQVGTDNDWSAIATGAQHCLAIKKDSTLWAWGDNSSGKLGYDYSIKISASAPFKVSTSHDWKVIAGGDDHSIAIKTDGSLYTCGGDYYGELGDGNNRTNFTLTRIGYATDTNWQYISGGYNHSVALRSDGSIWTWGRNYYGELGNGTSSDTNVPGLVPATTRNYTYSGCNSVIFRGTNYNASTVIIDTSTTSLGNTCCYNVYNIIVDNTVPINHSDSLIGCDSVVYNAKVYKKTTVVSEIFKTIYGCDSVYKTTKITVNAPPKRDTFATVCNSFLWNSVYYYRDTVVTYRKANVGCDSLEVLHLKVIKPANATTNVSGCNSYVFKGKTYTNSTSVIDTIRSIILGCDSIYNHCNITIYKLTPSTIKNNLSGCGSVTYNSVAYTASTIVSDTVRSSNGCDSIYNVANITVTPLASRDTLVSSCGSFNWFGTNYINDTVVSRHKINYVPITYNEGFSSSNFFLNVPTGWTFSSTINQYTSTGNFGASSPSLKFATNKDQVVTAAMSGSASQLSFWLKGLSASGGEFLVEGYNGISWVTVNSITTYPVNGTTFKYNATSTPKLPNGLTQFRFTYTKSSGNLAFDDVSISYIGNSGCDSLITLHLTTSKATTSTTNLSGCQVTYKGITYNNSAIIKDTIKTVQGCDSIYNVANITIYQNGISGKIIHPKGIGVPGVKVNLSGTSADSLLSNSTYQLNCLPLAGNYTVRLKKNNDISKANGVSTIDAALIQSHVLGKSLLNSPYKIIAADVNGDNKVSALDIVYIKRLILGLDTTYIGKRLWAFVDSTYKFMDTTNPFPYKDSISYTGLSVSKTNQTFIGMKLGDVNWDWNPTVAKPYNNTENAVELSYLSNTLKASDSYVRIPIKVKNFKEMMGMQFTLGFNAAALNFIGIENNLLNLETGTNHLAEGKLSLLWLDPMNEVKSIDDNSQLMVLVFERKQLSIINYLLSIDGSITTIEAFDKDYQLHGIVMRPSINSSEISKETWSIAPNPTTNGVIHIQMNLKDNKAIVFNLLDNTGRLLLSKKLEGIKGTNSVTLHQQSHLSEGMYYLQAIGMEGEEMKKVLVK